MPLDSLKSRFDRVQSLQNDFLNRIKEYRVSRDPSVLPDLREADRLDDELEDIVRELSDSDISSEQVVEASPRLLFLAPRSLEETVVSMELDDQIIERASPRAVAEVPEDLVLETMIPDNGSEQRLDIAPIDNPEPSRTESASEEIPLGGSAESPRRRKRLDSFIVVNDAKSAVDPQAASSPKPVPTFGQVVKEAVTQGDLEDSESSVAETYDEPPPTVRRRDFVVEKTPTLFTSGLPELMYASPTPPTSPPPLEPANTRSPSPTRRKISPLTRSNERRHSSPLRNDPAAFWRRVRAEREGFDSIMETLEKISKMNERIRKEFESVRVKPVGITCGYLFKLEEKKAEDMQEQELAVEGDPRKEEEVMAPPPEASGPDATTSPLINDFTSWISNLMESPGKPEAVVTADPVVFSPNARRRRSVQAGWEVMHAVVTIQKWYRRWGARRKEKMASMASMAEVEAVAARETLRRRRRQKNPNSWKIQEETIEL
jgi:hypothetical protein